MKRLISILALSGLIFSSLAFAEENVDAKLTVYRTTIAGLMQTLKAELMAAMKANGAINALDVCNTKAPQITTGFAAKAGFTIARTSLKPRNASNAPLEWQKAVLNEFEKRKTKGENPQKLEFHKIVEVNGQRQLRYMKTIPTIDKCLICHGENIAPRIQVKIKQLYPDDKATNFKQGDLRGAFIIVETLN
jgi:hypothetical protein